ncbi:MAG: YdcF family protein, partial [Erysipelotrichaceae bacterium]|nr:YdcF family protein [Erysipelotrichaceae bacterium]
YENEGIVELINSEHKGKYYEMLFVSLDKGSSEATIYAMYGDHEVEVDTQFEVNPFGVLIRYPLYDINQWQTLWVTFFLSAILGCGLLLQEFIIRINKDLYSYKTLQVGGIFFFVLGILILNLIVFLWIIPQYQRYSAMEVISFAVEIVLFFLLAAIPFVVGFGIALSISNLMLIRKEGVKFVNVLGILVSLAIIGSEIVLCVVSFLPYPYLAIVSEAVRKLVYVARGLFCFFLSYLLSTMVCGLIAAKRVPAFDKDYILILGCGIAKDGTLLPLLQGRADRAIWFYQQQLEKTGKKAIFIPSGGQGSDEVIAEGEAIKRYLISREIEEECILPEVKSTTTLENMKFSKQLIDERSENAKVIFSTTNYHVLRSGMLAKEANLKAEGIGSKTRWYFWPNAFVREFVGLLVSTWKFEVFFFGAAAIIFTIISIVY